MFQGKPKNKNRDVAIKQFHGMTNFYIKREVSTLKLAQTHKNIVKYIGFEEKHLIMELCTEGLDNLLSRHDDGLPTDELMVFIAHLFAGLKRLRKFNIIHRDLKPANMLVSRANGKNVFKISDFGAARILKDHEKTVSIHGTAEYLHPDILAKFYAYVLDVVPPTNYFMCKHDIWSIAVTIFEVATGKLPFEAKLGRQNMKLQYKMMMEKKHNDIYAEETESGEIKWFSNLPETCQMDEPLKAALKDLLIGMLKVIFS